MSSDRILRRLRQMKGSREWKDVAKDLGVSPAYLSDMLHGRRKNFKPKLLAKMGLRSKAIYVALASETSKR